VDVQNRLIEVVGPNGGLHQFSIPVSADKLFSVKAGDTVSVKYVESVIVAFQKASEPPMTAPPDKVTVTPAGLPDLTHVQVKVVNAKVTAVDTLSRVITFTTAGNTYHDTVGPGVKGFSQIKVGDDLILRATESTAIDITK
jgi:GTP:adenosylcobinamide-phosphate guanylyltransferase